MKITKSVGHRLNVGPYESLHISAEVTVDTDTDFATVPSDEAVLSYIEGLLDQLLEPDLNAASSLPALDPDSHVHAYVAR